MLEITELLGALSIGDQSWKDERAACIGVLDLFFLPGIGFEYKADRERREKKAKAICAGCLLLKPCFEAALHNNEKYGIWGGKTEAERRRILRRRAQSAEQQNK